MLWIRQTRHGAAAGTMTILRTMGLKVTPWRVGLPIRQPPRC